MEHCQWSIKRKFCCRKWNIYNTEVLKSNLCDYKDTFILVRGDITVLAAGADQLIQVAFKNCAPFTKCITKIDWRLRFRRCWRLRFSHADV